MKNIIETIDIKDIKRDTPTINYADSDILVTDSMEDIMCGYEEIRLGMAVAIFCMEGRIRLEMNDDTCALQRNDIIICLPHHIIGGIMSSNNHSVKVFCFSHSFVDETLRGKREFGPVIDHIHRNPIHRLRHESKGRSAVNLFGKLITAKMNDNNDCCRKIILHHMFAAFFCQVLASFGTSADNSHRTVNGERKSATLVFKNFMKELAKDEGRHRSVSYYADRLCYSTKYVSYAVKLVSGRTAMSWINEHTIGQIKYQLKNSDKSIKEIAEIFDFPNISFFGKYVKRNIGVSPREYRNGQ